MFLGRQAFAEGTTEAKRGKLGAQIWPFLAAGVRGREGDSHDLSVQQGFTWRRGKL
jgi:hypothetical protein